LVQAERPTTTRQVDSASSSEATGERFLWLLKTNLGLLSDIFL